MNERRVAAKFLPMVFWMKQQTLCETVAVVVGWVPNFQSADLVGVFAAYGNVSCWCCCWLTGYLCALIKVYSRILRVETLIKLIKTWL